MRTAILILGSLLGFVASLPLPWTLRVWMALGMQKTLGVLLYLFPRIYAVIANENKRYQMGKQTSGEMQSIMGLELVLRKIEQRNISPVEVKMALLEAKKRQIDNVSLPAFLGQAMLGADDTNRLLKGIVAF